jgi:hypothetical protein
MLPTLVADQSLLGSQAPLLRITSCASRRNSDCPPGKLSVPAQLMVTYYTLPACWAGPVGGWQFVYGDETEIWAGVVAPSKVK